MKKHMARFLRPLNDNEVRSLPARRASGERGWRDVPIYMHHDTTLTPGPSASRLSHELQALWRTATPDSIGPALVSARQRVAASPPAVQEEVAELMASLEQLERWLRDF